MKIRGRSCRANRQQKRKRRKKEVRNTKVHCDKRKERAVRREKPRVNSARASVEVKKNLRNEEK